MFLSYRRDDTGPAATILFSELERLLVPGQVALDHETVPPGGTWPAELDDALRRATVLLALSAPRG